MLSAEAAILQVNFENLSVSVMSVGEDVYRLSISPLPPGSPSPATEDVAGIRMNNGWLEARRLDDTNAPPAWRGRFSTLQSYGQARVPGTRLEWAAPPDEAIYGLGQRFNGLNQAGKFVEMWIRDAPGQGDEGEASYFCTPVLFSSAGYALFASDNPEGEFSLNPLGEGVNRYLRAGQTWTIYLALAPSLKELVQKRAQIQGPFRGVPDWAWGPWISRNSYEDQGEAEDAINGMVKRGFPVSVIVQEAWKGGSHTGDFNNFSKDRWTNLDSFLALCEKHGIRNVLWQVPIIHPTSPDFADAERRGFFVRKPDGTVSFRREWLEGFANVDFTNPEAVRWWKDQMRDEIRRGVLGFKADDGEDIKPDDVFSDGRRGWEMHNEYSALYDRALTELFDEEKADGMLWCRSASLGCERAPALWAGDQYATWPQYRSLLAAGLSSGLSGAPFWGHDIGGYIDNPTPELFIRWLQFGAFSPLMQYHGNKPREPWLFGKDAERAYGLLSHLRMNLRPTLKALGEESARTGLPMMRPMAMEFPDDPRFRDEDTQYMLGPDLLVTPVLEEGATGRRVKFPAGAWQHLLMPIAFNGPAEIDVPLDLVSAPVFVRQGASLSVELAKSARLGTWSADAGVRTLDFDKGRAVLTDLQFPLSGSTLSGQARISFKVRPDFAGALKAYSYPRQRPGERAPLVINRTGDQASIELRYPGAREADFVVVIHDESNTIFSGAVRWQSPLSIEARTAGSRMIGSGERRIQVRVGNRTGDTIPVKISATAKGAANVTNPDRAGTVPPRGEWTGEWSLQVESASDMADAVASFTARASDRILAATDVFFARPLRVAVAGPFPAHEKEAYHTPFPPEWVISSDARFQTTEGTVRWTTVPPDHQEKHDGIDFEELWGQRDHAAGYVQAKVKARSAGAAELRIGADDTVTAWLNGEKVFTKEVYRLSAWDQEIVPVHLAAGDNVLLFKVAQDRNPWRLLFHLTGPGGAPMVGITDAFDADAYRADREDKGPVLELPRPVSWHIAGPFPLEHQKDLKAAGQLDGLARSADPLSASNVSWQTASGPVNFNHLYGDQLFKDAYATSTWTVNKPTPIVLRCGSDDGVVIWLNGKQIHAVQKPRGFKRGEDSVRATLQPGRNVIFCRVRQGDGAWKFEADVWDASQKPMRPLTDF